MAFPKSFEGKDLLSKAPCRVTQKELNLYHLTVNEEESTQTESNENAEDSTADLIVKC